jgi:hypothetical protein
VTSILRPFKIRFKFKNPDASDEKVDGAVFRLAYEKKLRKNQIIEVNSQNETLKDHSITFKPDCSRTLKPNVTIKYKHTGIWE